MFRFADNEHTDLSSDDGTEWLTTLRKMKSMLIPAMGTRAYKGTGRFEICSNFPLRKEIFTITFVFTSCVKYANVSNRHRMKKPAK